MTLQPPTTIILPTVRMTPVIGELTDQLSPDDQLLVVCDTTSDPIANDAESLPTSARLIYAGEPEGCSGKANAIAAGIEAATNERLIWTDDDFHHPPGWLEQLHAEYDRHGPATELPVFVGRDPLSTLLEPMYLIGATAGLAVLKKPWAGAVIFERSDLASKPGRNEAAFLSELRRTISDDGLLSLYVDVTPVRRVREVAVGGSVRNSFERHVRFMQIGWRFAPNSWLMVPLSVLFFLSSLFAPLLTAVGATAGVTAVATYFGGRRSSALLAYPALLVQFPLLVYALARKEFVWAGRRYRWTGRFEVDVKKSE